ncbi:hypothetical protein [Microbispora bryophytorum]|uniref:Uncharacterized protein n=1 Tax=Microbispora bryophytorum TaxID=1460882 RepID=A0A8H9GYT9_9ACTN|nr:hypothetical protein [Microbispora bryophytorum]MBD3136845.1 hypothetical protein [Microbispora bryophytorum]GGO13134.1 hypothetical protein GCM10011574_32200 [Microbispora bryophytorum]
MSSIVQRIRDYLQSPKGRENVEKVKTKARDPHNQQRLRRLMDQWRGHRTHR